MEINDVSNENYVDLFGDATKPAPGELKATFGAEERTVDLFNKPAEDKKPEEDGAAAGEDDDKKKLEGEDKKPEGEGEGDDKQVDIIGDGKAGPGRKPKYAFEDAVGYFEDRMKNGKFVKVTTENEKGEEVLFVPKTPEEFDEVIDIQVSHRLEKEMKTLETTWLKSKSPAWQAVARYAELVDNPGDVIPFLEGVKAIESVANLNEEEIDGAEKIVRARMAQKGESDDIIDEQIELLKTTDKLVSTAKKYKPLILNDEREYLGRMKKEREQEEQQYQALVSNIRTKAIEAIEAPIFGKQKLKQEEKAIIYDLIGQPDPESRGYKIYTFIDNLFAKGDFDTLKQIALIAGGKKDSLFGYASIDAKNQTAAGLQHKLKVATENRGGSNQDPEDEVKVSRNQYKTTARFGR